MFDLILILILHATSNIHLHQSVLQAVPAAVLALFSEQSFRSTFVLS